MSKKFITVGDIKKQLEGVGDELNIWLVPSDGSRSVPIQSVEEVMIFGWDTANDGDNHIVLIKI